MKETYSINDVAMMTGLTTRTLRTYITMGFLSGDKTDGAWSFTPEQIETFTQHPAVKPSIHAKKNALIFDFLGSKPKDHDKMCTVIDLANGEAMKASIFFCERISSMKPETELHFASEPMGTGVRIILSGSPSDVMDLLSGYYAGKQ